MFVQSFFYSLSTISNDYFPILSNIIRLLFICLGQYLIEIQQSKNMGSLFQGFAIFILFGTIGIKMNTGTMYGCLANLQKQSKDQWSNSQTVYFRLFMIIKWKYYDLNIIYLVGLFVTGHGTTHNTAHHHSSTYDFF